MTVCKYGTSEIFYIYKKKTMHTVPVVIIGVLVNFFCRFCVLPHSCFTCVRYRSVVSYWWFSCKKIVLLVRICISPLRFFLCTSVSPLILSLWKAALAKIILVLCIYIFLLWYTHVLRISYLYLKLFSYLVNVTHIYYKICIHFPFPPFYFVSIFVFDVHYLPYNILLLINL